MTKTLLMIRLWLLWVKGTCGHFFSSWLRGRKHTGPVGCKSWCVVDAHILLVKREVITPKIKTLFCEGRNSASFS